MWVTFSGHWNGSFPYILEGGTAKLLRDADFLSHCCERQSTGEPSCFPFFLFCAYGAFRTIAGFRIHANPLKNLCMCVCTHMWIYTCMGMYICAYISVYIFKYTHAYVHRYVGYLCMFLYIFTWIHMHTHNAHVWMFYFPSASQFSRGREFCSIFLSVLLHKIHDKLVFLPSFFSF